MAVVYALLGTIVAEFLGAQQGMGVVITQAESVTDVAGVFAALIILGALGIALHGLVRRAGTPRGPLGRPRQTLTRESNRPMTDIVPADRDARWRWPAAPSPPALATALPRVAMRPGSRASCASASASSR